MSPTNYAYNVTFWEQWYYYSSANKTGLRGYPGEVEPVTLSDYLELIPDQYSPIFNSIASAIWTYTCLVTLGIIGNVVNIVVFTRPSMVGPLNFLLTCLESANLVFYISFIPEIVLMAFYSNYRDSYESQLTVGIICAMNDAVIFMSNWCNVIIGLFRFIAVTWPLSAKRWCSNTRAKLSALFIGLASVTVGLVMYCLFIPTLNVVAVYEDEDSETPLFVETVYVFKSIIPFEDEGSEFRLESVLNLFSTTIPCLISALFTLLLIGNLCVAKKRRRRLQENGVSNPAIEIDPTNENPEAPRGNTTERNTTDVETRLTITLLIVIVISNLCYLPTSIQYIVLLTAEDSNLDSIIIKVSASEIGIFLSNCITFFVYVTMSQRFRKTFLDLVCSLFKKNGRSLTGLPRRFRVGKVDTSPV